MAKIQVTIKHTQTATLDTGDLPYRFIEDLLKKNDGTFDGNWGLGDVKNGDEWNVDSIEVQEVK